MNVLYSLCWNKTELRSLARGWVPVMSPPALSDDVVVLSTAPSRLDVETASMRMSAGLASSGNERLSGGALKYAIASALDPENSNEPPDPQQEREERGGRAEVQSAHWS